MLTEVDLARLPDDGCRHELRAGFARAHALGRVLGDAGARLVWIVDPADRSVSVFRPFAAPRRFESNDWLDGAEVLPGLSIQVAALFAP